MTYQAICVQAFEPHTGNHRRFPEEKTDVVETINLRRVVGSKYTRLAIALTTASDKTERARRT
jgi:hypothetical protein